jgi:hypothetical protein
MEAKITLNIEADLLPSLIRVSAIMCAESGRNQPESRWRESGVIAKTAAKEGVA